MRKNGQNWNLNKGSYVNKNIHILGVLFCTAKNVDMWKT